MSYHDHHFHPFGYVGMVNGLDLFDAGSIEEVQRLVAEYATRVEGPVVAERVNDEGLAELRLPTALDLDEAVPGRPTVVYRYCGHIAIANSAALAMAGIDAGTPDPPGGIFDRNPDGSPNGILRENAMDVVARALTPHISPPTDGEILSALATLPALGVESITGIVSVGDALWAGVHDEVGALVRLAPDLPISIDVLVITHSPEDLVDAQRRLDHAEGPVRFLGWKGFSDGSFGGHTAAMYESYTDRPDTAGTVLLDHHAAVEMGLASYRLGGVVAIHAIGDLANDLVLDVMEELISKGVHPESTRIEHASILTPAGIERMGRLGVTASVQPAFMVSEENWLHKRMGPERMERVYPLRSFLDAGIPVIGGSDCPVEPPEPRPAIAAAVNRPGFNPAEAITEDEAETLFRPPGH